MNLQNWKDVLHFWFEEISPNKHWVKDPKFDHEVRSRFGELLEAASRCELWSWRSDPQGRLAEVIVLDQFSRNIHRDTRRAFSQDTLALALAQEAILLGADREIHPQGVSFLYMPYMHSESKVIHEEAVRLFTRSGSKDSLDFEMKHKAIIDRFGRYPHRNQILGRESTPEEIEFLKGPGSSF